MSAANCCTIIVPGPQGGTGAAGTNGSDGDNGFSVLTAAFTMPAVGAAATATVDSTAWAVDPGAAPFVTVFVSFLGYLQVTGVIDSTHLSLTNLGYAVNAAVGNISPVNGVVAPAGPIGATGALAGSAASGVLAGTYPSPTFALTVLSALGELITFNGTTAIKQAAGAANQFLAALPGGATGLQWRAVNIATADVTGILPLANGGTAAATAAGARTSLGLGSIATQAANAVAITGGTVTGITDLALADGGSGASTAAGARAAFGVDRTLQDIVIVREEQASATDGGAFNNSAWRVRVLNTEVTDTGSHAALAANQVTLEAGTYRFRIRCPAYKVDNHQARLANVTDSSYIYGTTARAAAADDIMTESVIEGRFTIAAQKVFQVEHQCSATKAADGFGKASGFGNVEVYTVAIFEREAG